MECEKQPLYGANARIDKLFVIYTIFAWRNIAQSLFRYYPILAANQHQLSYIF